MVQWGFIDELMIDILSTSWVVGDLIHTGNGFLPRNSKSRVPYGREPNYAQPLFRNFLRFVASAARASFAHSECMIK